MVFDFDSVVIGAGVVGLSIARSLAETGKTVLIVEAESDFGKGISSRNSEVIHAGIYYPTNSLKRSLCVSGKDLLVDYCVSHNVDHKILGKLIVANTKEEIFILGKIFENGIRNGVTDLKMVLPDEISQLEPNLRANKAIISPSTGIVDSHGLMLALLGDFENAGGLLSCNSPISRIKVLKIGFALTVGLKENFEITCRELINSAGLSAQKISMMIKNIEVGPVPESKYCKGTYFSYSKKSDFSRLIYPVPNNSGLGVHLTLDLAGRSKFGPDTEWVDTPNYDVNPKRKNEFIKAIKTYFPDLSGEALMPDYAGVRPKIVSENEPASDFMIQFSDQHLIPGYVALYGIESPGLTSALAIGNLISRKLN